ncbi:MAG: hybrid sensor histidine kinase/response regulator [Betaproteobacteria bacterium]|nr:hybrid sensor histidine kinase/response regulator [Betaproteobacteria bacterium]
MSAPAALAPALIARARADQVAQLYASWHRTTTSMLLGAALLCFVLWGHAAPAWIAAWVALIVANQAWRGLLVRAWTRARPGIDAARRWGRYWSVGSALAGGLWGLAALAMYPVSPPHQALLIVCVFGAVLGGLNLTAVYRPAFYGFALPALVPLIARVAIEGDEVHLYTALVMTVVLAFILAFGHQLNDVLTRSLAMRYENVDLIAELKGRTRAADEARAAAEAANRTKSQLLAAASHDLRQPLHALGLYIAALAARAGAAEWRPLVGSVQRAVAALEEQFEQLLDLSRLEAGAMSPAPRRVAVGPLLARIVADQAPHAQAKGLTLRAATTRLAVRSDAALLERMLRNLVANAIRYTETGGVLVGARRRHGRVALEVVDTGMGIAPEHRGRIFEEFYQVRGAGGRRAHAGMGLGLAIVRRLAALLDHRVHVDSRVGRGSRFAIYAPRAHPDAARTGRDRRPRPASIAGALVGVIDDDPASVDAMGALFATWDADVAGAADAPQLLAALGRAERYPDLVVADLRLADGGSGVEAVRTLRDELGFVVPALLVSGDLGAAAERDARAAGLMLLGKPVVPAVLQALAAALIARGASETSPG